MRTTLTAYAHVAKSVGWPTSADTLPPQVPDCYFYMMNNHRAPGGTPHDPAHHPAELSELREIRETVLQASHAQQRMTRTVLEALDRLEHRYGPPTDPGSGGR